MFTALWVSDLFMDRVQSNAEWSLFCPNECPGLTDLYGSEYETLYARYESEGKARETVRAQDIWNRMVESQIETGTPYIVFKDAANNKSNQKNLGTIKCSNLCVGPDTLVLTSDGHIPISTLAAVGGMVSVWNGDVFSPVQVML